MRLIVLLSACFTFCVVGSTTGPSLWPMPQAIVVGENYAVLSPTFSITSNLLKCDVLDQAITRYIKTLNQLNCLSLDNALTYKRKNKSRKFQRVRRVNARYDEDELTSLLITVRGPCEIYPTDTSDEKYTLQVHTPSSEGNAQLIAATVWGAIRGLETFSQLVYEQQSNSGVKLLVNTSSIIDFPRFGFRGLMLDTSRHYVPVHVLLENLEAMAQNKLNVFHWHIVDDQSFPYVSMVYPEMSEKGAFDKNHIYTQDDIAEVIEFARLRGIRVIPEFDTPGHTLSWGKAETDLLTPCFKGGVPDGTFGPIDPIRNSTYDFISKLLGEVAQVFPDSYMHLGGDEVDFSCWKTNPDILDFMLKKKIANDFGKLEEYYVQKVVDIVQKNLNKKTLVWQEVFDNQVQIDKETLVHVWKDGYKDELAKVTQAGYKTILSSCWYLNYISYGIDWHPYYACDPQDFTGTADQKNLVIGGASAMWGEYVDGTGVMPRTWPRSSTVAERLWSSQDLKDVNQAVPRLNGHRCRMLKRGLRVEPPNGPGFCPCDPFI